VTVLVDTSVLVDYLRGRPEAGTLLTAERAAGALHASEITRLEVLAGMRPKEHAATRSLLASLRWHPVDEAVAERAGALGRAWLPSHHAIDAADLAIAATAELLEARLLTLNVRHFPMVAGLTRPY
jgi:predicted nucleic acid-binding protein